MEKLKEILKLVEERKEKAIEEYYDYIMDCDRSNKVVDHFQLGRLQGHIDEQKQMIKTIESIINANTPKKEADKEKEPSTKDLAEMLEVLAFLSFLNDVLGIPTELKVIVNKCDESKKIKIGDMVEVIDCERTCSIYNSWKGLKGQEHNYLNGASPKYEKPYKVLNIEEHGLAYGNQLFALIQDPDSEQVYIISMSGIRKL